jgi:hypothetical protein
VVPGEKEAVCTHFHTEPEYVGNSEGEHEIGLTPELLAISKDEQDSVIVLALTRAQDLLLVPSQEQDSLLVPSQEQDVLFELIQEQDVLVVPSQEQDVLLELTQEQDLCLVLRDLSPIGHSRD